MISAKEIIAELRVLAEINVDFEVQRRIAFIQHCLKKAQCHHLILGISGGVDSTLCGKLAQLAVEQLRQETQENYQFIAIRLPYAQQQDEDDAQSALAFIQPDQTLTINIQAATDALHQEVVHTLALAQQLPENSDKIDFVKGNVKARQRMVAQYEVAGMLNGLVVGTDHSAENLTGFYTKWGDGACDLAPLYGLNKRQIRRIAATLGATAHLVDKIPTADLQSQNPLQADEVALGVSYQHIDDFLEGKAISPEIENHLIQLYLRSAHKRRAIPTIYDTIIE